MRRYLVIAACIAVVGAFENPAHSAPCQAKLTRTQTASFNLAVRLQHTAVDISKTVGGPKADAAVHALMDLVESIDKTLPVECR